MTEALKACPNPWCGSEKTYRDCRENGWRFRCLHCGASPVSLATTEVGAIAAWNTRTPLAGLERDPTAEMFDAAWPLRDIERGVVVDGVRSMQPDWTWTCGQVWRAMYDAAPKPEQPAGGEVAEMVERVRDGLQLANTLAADVPITNQARDKLNRAFEAADLLERLSPNAGREAGLREEDASGEDGASASYDERADVLYVSLPPGPCPAVSYERSIDAVLRFAEDRLVGVTIVDFVEQAHAALTATPPEAFDVDERARLRTALEQLISAANNAAESANIGTMDEAIRVARAALASGSGRVG